MQPARETQDIGAILDDFSRPDLQSKQDWTLTAGLTARRGAVIMFWSGVCSHCVRYDAYCNSFAERHPELAFVALASRSGETAQMIGESIAERKLKFPILHDPTSALAREWFTQQTPRVFLLDSQRTLLYRGAIDNFKYPQDPQYEPYLEPAIAAFLAGKPVERTETASFGCAIQSVYYILPKVL